jgi:hypothetical protein
MSSFLTYLQIGFEHITDKAAYDHMLFIAALCASYGVGDWRRLLWLVTAFTLGHSLTLALSTYNLVEPNMAFIEFLIPCTILATCVLNYFVGRQGAGAGLSKHTELRFQYPLVAFFGLIHGLGFSNYLKALLGKSANVAAELLAFNLGVEIGQIAVVLAVLGVGLIFVRLLRMPVREWNLVLSAMAAAWSISLIVKAYPF